MKKAAAVSFIILLGLATSAFAEGPAVGREHGSSFVLAEGQGSVTFSLAPQVSPARLAVETGFDAPLRGPAEEGLDRPIPGDPAFPPTVAELTASVVAKGSPALVSVSIFLGRGSGDPFTSLHEQYAWRPAFKATNLGAGLYRDIRITRTIRIQPYVGVIRSMARLRPAGTVNSFEYRLTALCLGLPLVCGF